MRRIQVGALALALMLPVGTFVQPTTHLKKKAVTTETEEEREYTSEEEIPTETEAESKTSDDSPGGGHALPPHLEGFVLRVYGALQAVVSLTAIQEGHRRPFYLLYHRLVFYDLV